MKPSERESLIWLKNTYDSLMQPFMDRVIPGIDFLFDFGRSLLLMHWVCETHKRKNSSISIKCNT